ncbi:MAG: azurin [Proteobacteria bacterium]|nr:azurin [Pseudomonadota bacterium]
MRGYAVGCLALGLLVYGGAAHAADKLCKLEISGNDLLQYDKAELKVAADCTKVELTLKHTGQLPAQTMGHTWVLTKTADVQGVLDAGAAAGIAHSYEPPGDKRMIAATKLVGGGQVTSVTFSTVGLQKGGDYTYFCTFPGHAALMRGKFIFG